MIISKQAIGRLRNFIERSHAETYPEPPSFAHAKITEYVLSTYLPHFNINQNTRFLDVGCGHGVAMDILMHNGYINVTGVTLNAEDIRICSSKGHKVFLMDQSFLDFADNSFDFVWARHVIEHSLFPYFTLNEFSRVLSTTGWLYMEVPAAEINNHELNQNHYSVLGRSAWLALLTRSGFTVLEQPRFPFNWENIGPDEYWGFFCRKSNTALPV